jgi:DNA polymerase III subunit gamma/tau
MRRTATVRTAARPRYSRRVAYQSLYRKYRPQRFADLVGQVHVSTALRNAVRDGKVGHAYLFSGPRGTGKTTTARILAKALNCEALVDGDPCGVCESCVAIAQGTSLDVIEVDAASKSRVEEMRDLLERVAYLSAGGAKKVYILDEVHMLSASAEAALLKTLEESPEHVVFVLATTDPLKVAPTIRSRTQHFDFTLYTTDEITAHLQRVTESEGVDATPEALAIIARAGAGSMRDALSLLDQAMAHGSLDIDSVGSLLGGSAFDARLRILGAVVDEDVAGALVGLAEELASGHEPRRLAEDLLVTARDAFLVQVGQGRVEVDASAEELASLGELGEHAGQGRLVRVVETLGQAVVDMRGADAADPRLVLEVALVRLARREAGPPLQVLAERIERLEQAVAGGAALPEGVTRGAEPELPARPARTFGDLRRERASSEPPPEASAASDEPTPSSESAAAARAADDPAPIDLPPTDLPPVDLDDVIVAWAAILPGFPPATKAAAKEAQPISIDGDVIVFGVPRNLLESSKPRFRREADTIRGALSERLGRRGLKFSLVAHDGFAEVPSDPPRTAKGASAEPAAPPAPTAVDVPPQDDDEHIDITELVDAPPGDAAVDSLSMLTRQLDATVVEEVPHE